MEEVLFGIIVCAMLICVVWFLLKINNDTDDYPVKYKKRK